jgi:hypothetical protein
MRFIDDREIEPCDPFVDHNHKRGKQRAVRHEG